MSSLQANVKPKAQDIFRSLWASLFFTNGSRKSVLMCSADRGEGVTTLASGLALTGATQNNPLSVVLVDFNLRHPDVHDLFGLTQTPGLCEVLTGSLPLSQAVQDVNGLAVLPAGDGCGRVLEMLRGDRIADFLRELSQRYAYVIVDAPAINHYPDALILSDTINDVVLVANSAVTPREAVAQAVKRIESGSGKVAGAVLNMREYPIPKFIYRRV